MPAPLTIACPACHGKLKIPNRSVAGKRVRCPKCEHPFVVTLPDEDKPDDEFGGLDEFEDFEDTEGQDEEEDDPRPQRKPARSGGRSGGSRKKPGKRKAVNWQLPATIGGIAVGVAAFVGLIVWLVGAAGASSAAPDMAWLPPESELIFSARVGKIAQDPNLQQVLNHPDVQSDVAEFKQKIGLQPDEDFAAIESVVFGVQNVKQIQQPRPGDAPDLIGVARKKTPWNVEAVKKSGREATHEGKTYYVVTTDGGGEALALYYPDPNTCVLGPEKALKPALTRGGSSSTQARFQFVDFSKDVVIAFAPNDRSVFQLPQQQPLNPMMMMMGGIGPAVQNLMEVVPQLQGVAVGADIGSSPQLLAQANFNDSASASKCQGALETIVAEGRKMLDQMKGQAGPMAAQMAEVETALNSLSISSRGSAVSAGITLPASAQKQMVDTNQLVRALRQARGTAGRKKSQNNLRQIGLALHNFHSTYNMLPVAKNPEYRDSTGRPLLSWRVHILPFIEQSDLYKQFHLNEPWNSPHNQALVARMPDVYKSPASKAPPGRTTYLAVSGPGTVFENGGGKSFHNITDGMSSTVVVVDVSDSRAVEWTRPDDFEFNPSNPLMGLIRPGEPQFTALMADGSVHEISLRLGPQLKALFTCAGGEPPVPGL